MTSHTTEPGHPTAIPDSASSESARGFLVSIVGATALAHGCNDMIQSVLPSIYPMLKANFTLSYTQIGLISLVYQITASLLQPWIGLYTDKHPKPLLLPSGMGVTLLGIGLLAIAGNFLTILIAAAMVGVGSSVFHPEASRIARMASGGRFGTAQSAFQVGGNTGSSFGPLLAALLIIPHGQLSVAWLMVCAFIAIVILTKLSHWSAHYGQMHMKRHNSAVVQQLSRAKVFQALVVVGILMFAKFTYIASLSNYFTFYLVHHFSLPLEKAQLCLFAFLAAVAVGTFAGGPVGDRLGRKAVVWISFLGVIPFSLALPYVDLHWTIVFTIIIGLILSSAFSALVVYAQEIIPGRSGMVAGIMFGTMFGIGGLAAAGLGKLADIHGIDWVYSLCAFLPLLGFITLFMPDTRKSLKK
ncbi:MFS transporter [Tatumella citrea]|uniref:Fosmidomycin resistance protein n=1 Tax=Tatumella citrea TaxID=53336 RepID=A0A1Y0L8L8_TATCI|nr:MFS transporter [Tatumella citrea]ARU94392.1 Fosmidomycin resistance protein [Tatumella citrea]ARU98431.1 Fosmidomycin resistance protein [Tatumella citrea]